jgi:hypothetical protein
MSARAREAEAMSTMKSQATAAGMLLDRDEVEGVLSGTFYTPAPDPEPERRSARPSEKPAHYKVICISLYTGDLERLDEMVDELKAMGITKANRSALIRHALATVDLQKVPRGM